MRKRPSREDPSEYEYEFRFLAFPEPLHVANAEEFGTWAASRRQILADEEAIDVFGLPRWVEQLQQQPQQQSKGKGKGGKGDNNSNNNSNNSNDTKEEKGRGGKGKGKGKGKRRYVDRAKAASAAGTW